MLTHCSSNNSGLSKTKFNWWKGKPTGSIACTKNAASVLLKLFISSNEGCHTTAAWAHERNYFSENVNNYDPWRPDKFNYTIKNKCVWQCIGIINTIEFRRIRCTPCFVSAPCLRMTACPWTMAERSEVFWRVPNSWRVHNLVTQTLRFR